VSVLPELSSEPGEIGMGGQSGETYRYVFGIGETGSGKYQFGDGNPVYTNNFSSTPMG
jgi:hypothetical protein